MLCGAEGAGRMLPEDSGPRRILAGFTLSHFRLEGYSEVSQRPIPEMVMRDFLRGGISRIACLIFVYRDRDAFSSDRPGRAAITFSVFDSNEREKCD